MPISPNFTSIFSKDWIINFMQCTPNGYLKYTDLCNIMQLTAASHSEIGGISFVDMQQFDQAWVLSRMRVEITELPKWKDIITVKTWINTMENSRSIRAIEVFVNHKKLIGSETFWAVFNTKKRRPETLMLPFDHFGLYPQKLATKENFTKINIATNTNLVSEKTVYLSDLDIVNHVNNVKYLEWCLDFVDENLILNQKIVSFDMNFMKELSLKDKVEIHEKLDENRTVYHISKYEKTCFALQINW